METSPLICSANHWTGFYMIAASVMKGLTAFNKRLYIHMLLVGGRLISVLSILLTETVILRCSCE